MALPSHHTPMHSKNGKDLGVAYQIMGDLERSPLFPACTLKNAELHFNFGSQPFKYPPAVSVHLAEKHRCTITHMCDTAFLFSFESIPPHPCTGRLCGDSGAARKQLGQCIWSVHLYPYAASPCFSFFTLSSLRHLYFFFLYFLICRRQRRGRRIFWRHTQRQAFCHHSGALARAGRADARPDPLV